MLVFNLSSWSGVRTIVGVAIGIAERGERREGEREEKNGRHMYTTNKPSVLRQP